MSRHLQRVITMTVIAITIGASAAKAQAGVANGIKVPAVPPGLEVPAGNTPFLQGHALGTQNYVCLPSGAGFSWTFFAPQATLFFTFRLFNNDISQQIITHFLSPNPVENGTARATWQSSLDTSAVWARATASSTDANFVEAGAIPWLLLQATGANRGPTGGSIMTPTTFIHRLNTSGGVAPSTGCTEAANVGKTALVPYTADYFFYRAAN